jgi:hypothetical protein
MTNAKWSEPDWPMTKEAQESNDEHRNEPRLRGPEPSLQVEAYRLTSDQSTFWKTSINQPEMLQEKGRRRVRESPLTYRHQNTAVNVRMALILFQPCGFDHQRGSPRSHRFSECPRQHPSAGRCVHSARSPLAG